MLDAVRNFFRHDDEAEMKKSSERAPGSPEAVSGGASPTGTPAQAEVEAPLASAAAPPPTVPLTEIESPSDADEAAPTAVEVSPATHAPQGLAAETDRPEGMAATPVPAAADGAEAPPSGVGAEGLPSARAETAMPEGVTAAAGATSGVAPAAEAEPLVAAVVEAEPVAAPAVEEGDQPAAVEPLVAYAPGTTIDGRYTIGATAPEAPDADTLIYSAADHRSYERCWSCGSTANMPGTRFCQQCGAAIQDRPVTLVQTRVASGEAGEVEQDGRYIHLQPERRSFGSEGVGIEVGAHSAEGPHHPNEDSYWYTIQTLCGNSQRQSVAVVVFSDGMGGYAPGSGLISARIAATAGAQIVSALQSGEGGVLDGAALEATVREAVAAANAMVLEEIAHSGEMGATLVVLVVVGETAYLANIGDSRAYYLDPRGRVSAITQDQSLVALEVAQGRLSESEMYTAPGNNIILHAIGEPGVEQSLDWVTQPLEPGSYLLLCSDGYWKTLRGAVVVEGTLGQVETLSTAAQQMVDHALAEGSDDNTTVVLVAIR